MRVGIIVDHPKRDLDGIIMLSHALTSRGHTAFIIPNYEQATDVPLLYLDIIVVNFARPANLELVKGYVKQNIKVVVMDTEAGVMAEQGANSPNQLSQFIKDSGFSELLSGYIFWGSTLYTVFKENNVFPDSKLFLTGVPRFDFTSAQWRELLTHKRSDYVLVNCNFPIVNPRFVSSADSEIETMVQAGWGREYSEQVFNDLSIIIRQVTEITERLAKDFPEETFLVRPHPFENAQYYKKAFEAYNNIVVDGEGSVLNVINNSKCIIHLNCGTSVEAVMLDKLPISLECFNTPHMAQHSKLPSKVSFPVVNYEELQQSLANLEKTTSEFPFDEVYDAEIKQWFHLNDGCSAKRIVDRLESMEEGLGSASGVAWSLKASRENARFIQKAQSLLGNIVGSKASSRLRAHFQSSRKDKLIETCTVASRMEEICSAADSNKVPCVVHAKHPVHGVKLSSIKISHK